MQSRKDLLVMADDGSIPLEKVANSSLSEKIDLAWHVYQSAEERYRPAALEFLRRQFQIPKSLGLSGLESVIENLIKLKTPDQIVTFPEQRPMNKLPYIRVLYEKDAFFMNAVNRNIFRLNQLITQYHSKKTQAERIASLKEIHKIYLQIQHDYSSIQIGKCQSFQTQILSNFFSQLQEQLSVNDLTSISQLDESPIKIDAIPGAEEISTLIANMSAVKLTTLHDALATQYFQNFLDLYQKDEPEYALLQNFLMNHTIQFLGGGNSKNFKISPNNGNPPFVLKLENRLGLPKSLEFDLRANLPENFFTRVSVSRQSFLPIRTHFSSIGYIEVGEFCPHGDIESYGAAIKGPRTSDALAIYIQMSQMVDKLREFGIAFPDMKNSNWLMDAHKNIRVADNKSFIYTINQQIIPSEIKQTGYDFLRSLHIAPPEYRRLDAFSADNMHAYIIGKNLYQFLSGCRNQYLYDKSDASQLDFNGLEFRGEVGLRLKSLIERLVKSNPSERLSVKEAIDELKAIQLINLRNECSKLIQGLKELDSSLVNELSIQQQEQALKNAQNFEDLKAFKVQIQQYLAPIQLKNTCLKLLNEFENKEDRFYLSLKEKFENCVDDGKLDGLISEILLHLRPKHQANCQAMLDDLESLTIDPEDKSYFLRLRVKSGNKGSDFFALREKIAFFYETCYCKKQIYELNKLRLDDKDEFIHRFIDEQCQKLDACVTIADVTGLKQELEAYLNALNNPVLALIKTQMNELSYRWGGADKARLIHQAVMALSLEDRMKLADPSQRESILKEVLEAMAHHRHGAQSIYRTETGAIDESKAARSYVKFIEELRALTDVSGEDHPYNSGKKTP